MKNNIAYYIEYLLINAGIDKLTARFIVSQSAFETGNFASKVFIENNNAFGMKEAVKRLTTNIGTKNNHADYKDIDDSVKDYILYYSYQSYPKKFQTLKDFVRAIKEKSYFESDEEKYLKGTEYYYNLYYGS